MENISKIANNVLSSKPELELTRIWGELMCRNNVALNTEESEVVQTLVVDAYEGIRHKLGREKIDENILAGAFDEIKDALAFGEMLSSDAIKDVSEKVFEQMQNGGVDLGGITIRSIDPNNPQNQFGMLTPEQISAAINEGKLEPANDGKVVEMPQQKTRKTVAKGTVTE